MVFSSLLLSAAIGVLFGPSDVTETMRKNLRGEPGYNDSVQAAIGMLIIISIFFSLFALIATFAAWAIVSSLNDVNAHAVIRSSIGLYTTNLPSFLVSMAIYSQFVWMALWLFVLLEDLTWAIPTVIVAITIFFHIQTVYSALGNVVMLTGAMGPKPIFKIDDEEAQLPFDLQDNLIDIAKEQLAKKIAVTAQYRPPDEGTLKVADTPQDTTTENQIAVKQM
eukprot:CAMPEP_0195520310 /NCGR_PEP_ID=MMETSP0794_2-20130614/16614_1 /TAXON_ID=515487 /ORGANISM="Stephanopyxis turris, Strain CCMP 815" /LENGTH=221 /DNA_ID=CAMNT_0040649643 /DNA_START=452 /DNA_END=1117 /DNA_ORIENTATION=-